VKALEEVCGVWQVGGSGCDGGAVKMREEERG